MGKNQKVWQNLTQKLNDFSIQAGWFENTRYDADTPVGMIARIQNDGAVAHPKVTDKMRNYLHLLGIHLKKTTEQLTIVIPPRPFMDNARKRVNGEEGRLVITQELMRVFEGKQTMEQAARRLGIWVQGIIQDELRKIEDPALSPLTIQSRDLSYKSKSKNKSTKPLNATGFMLNTVEFKVEKK